MIMEFCYIEPEDFADMLVLLKPSGSAFYTRHVPKSSQFMPHSRKFAYQDSEKFAQFTTNLTADKLPDWSPSLESLRVKSFKALREDHTLEGIYCNIRRIGKISRPLVFGLTFSFTNEIYSPPYGSY